jgi:hypothetical protein
MYVGQHCTSLSYLSTSKSLSLTGTYLLTSLSLSLSFPIAQEDSKVAVKKLTNTQKGQDKAPKGGKAEATKVSLEERTSP